ncbi:MAG: BadF/BadG/BcrA/BcrD ATPase family protein, partial [Planctomycetota bacterium]
MANRFKVENNRGQPLSVVREFAQEFPSGTCFGVSGNLGHISEVAATEAALAYVGGDFDAVASMGGESFTLYLLKDAKIQSVLVHNRCAAGTGEFLVQQIGCLGLTLEQAVAGALDGHVVPMASRCSVHCKSDITHTLNRNEATINDILHTLHDMMANGIGALLSKAQRPVRRLLVVGGVARNRALISALQSQCDNCEVVVLRESPRFQALGAAVLTRASPVHEAPFVTVASAPPRLTVDDSGMVTTSTGARIPITDPRVTFYFFSFSYYHGLAARLAGRWLGLNVKPPIDLNRGHLERGLRHTTGRECLPLPITIGQMLEANERRAPGEIQAFHMLSGGEPCVVTCYADFFRRFVRDKRLNNVLIFDPGPDNGYCGLNSWKMEQMLTPAMTLADLFVEMEHSLHVVGCPRSREQLRACWDEYVCSAGSPGELRGGLETIADRVGAISHGDPTHCPKVVVTGDFFTRFNALFIEGIHELHASHGIILIPADLNEQFKYGAYSRMAAASEAWGVTPDSLQATASACLRV